MSNIENAEKHVPPIEPILCSIRDAMAIIGRSERSVIDMIARGKLEAVKSDRRVLVKVASLRDYVNSLPAAKGTINRRPSDVRREPAVA
jgi:hypothetical protein